MIKLLVPKEIIKGEKRVAATPETVKRFVKLGCTVTVESGAGMNSRISDSEFEAAGATIGTDTKSLYADADIVLKVRQPAMNDSLDIHETDMLKEGSGLITTLQPFSNTEETKMLIQKKITSFSMDFIPRISRAQKMDSLSSQSNIAGYQAVLIAATALEKYFPMLMTAAGTIKPALVVVIGAGVAGLQAVATARRLGALVEVSDIRPAVKEQVESLGAKFIELETDEVLEDAGGYAKEVSAEFLEKQRQLLHNRVAAADVVICTALVPGKKAPVIIDADMVRDMRPGSIVVDLAVEQGGNCELSEAGKAVDINGVRIIGQLDVPSSMSIHASETYSKNIANFFHELVTDGKIYIDLENEVLSGSLITHEGKLMQDRLKDAIEGGDRQ